MIAIMRLSATSIVLIYRGVSTYDHAGCGPRPREASFQQRQAGQGQPKDRVSAVEIAMLKLLDTPCGADQEAQDFTDRPAGQAAQGCTDHCLVDAARVVGHVTLRPSRTQRSSLPSSDVRTGSARSSCELSSVSGSRPLSGESPRNSALGADSVHWLQQVPHLLRDKHAGPKNSANVEWS